MTKPDAYAMEGGASLVPASATARGSSKITDHSKVVVFQFDATAAR